MGYVSEEVVRVLRDTGCRDVINQGVEPQCRETISTPIEDVQTIDLCDTYVCTDDDIDSDQGVSNNEVSPANVDKTVSGRPTAQTRGLQSKQVDLENETKTRLNRYQSRNNCM